MVKNRINYEVIGLVPAGGKTSRIAPLPCSIDDVEEGLMSAAQASNVEGRTIDIGSGELVSIRINYATHFLYY